MATDKNEIISPVDSTPAITGPRPPLQPEEVREDRWVALLFLLFGIVFALFLLWEPVSCWLRR